MTDSPGSLRMPVVPGLSGFSLLARGGYATVYRAIQDFVGREVAVKVENRTLDSERDQRRFLREARAAGRMSSHPHVVDLFDAGVTADQHPYLIMELCDGSYADRMKTSPLSPAEAREVGVKIADALADAHQLGVLHRDVKPANILCSRFGEPALADFGLAILAETRDSSVTLEVLTPAYAPPEMFRHSAPSPAVDVYALCATLYATMRGKPPRWHDDRSPSLITLMELFTEPIPDLPGVPHELMEVLRAGMANDPTARPTAEQLRDMLAAVRLEPTPDPVGSAGAGTVHAAASGPPPLAPTSGGATPTSGGATPTSGGPTPTSGGGEGSMTSSGLYGHTVWPSSPAAGSGGSATGRGTVYPRPAAADDDVTVPTKKRRRLLGWFIGGASALVLLLAGGVGAWVLAQDPDPRPSPGKVATGTPVPSLLTISPGGGSLVLPGCLALRPEQGRCPDKLECFGAAEPRGGVITAPEVSCTGRHTWEVYALGELPIDTDPNEAHADPTVKRLCNEGNFRVVSLRLDTGWRFEVLAPDREAFASGERTYRCVAGKGPDRLDGPTLTR